MEDGKDHTSGKKKSFAVEPIGGAGGDNWDDGIYNGVREIALSHQNRIDWIRVTYDKNGVPFTAKKRGGGNRSPDTPNDEVKLNFPEEFLISVSGHYGFHYGVNVIRSLSFKSNKKSYGPYGAEQGTPFTLSLDGVDVVGFKGRCGWHLDAIGFHLSKKELPTKPLQMV